MKVLFFKDGNYKYTQIQIYLAYNRICSHLPDQIVSLAKYRLVVNGDCSFVIILLGDSSAPNQRIVATVGYR